MVMLVFITFRTHFLRLMLILAAIFEPIGHQWLVLCRHHNVLLHIVLHQLFGDNNNNNENGFLRKRGALKIFPPFLLNLKHILNRTL
jgi:hypothetical protein